MTLVTMLCKSVKTAEGVLFGFCVKALRAASKTPVFTKRRFVALDTPFRDPRNAVSRQPVRRPYLTEIFLPLMM